MAVLAEGRALTELHRRAQLTIRARAIQQIIALWPALDLNDLERSFPPFSLAADALIQAASRESGGTAAAYYRAFRSAEGVAATNLQRIVRTSPIPTAQVVASLGTSTFASYRGALSRGSTPAQAAQKALEDTVGTTARLSLIGGRQTLAGAIQRDPRALGFARVTDGNPCFFCAMLSSRGAVYTEDTAITAADGDRYHDDCGCTMEPVFSRDKYFAPGRSAEFSQLYAESTSGLTGKDAVNAFRRAYDASRS